MITSAWLERKIAFFGSNKMLRKQLHILKKLKNCFRKRWGQNFTSCLADFFFCYSSCRSSLQILMFSYFFLFFLLSDFSSWLVSSSELNWNLFLFIFFTFAHLTSGSISSPPADLSSLSSALLKRGEPSPLGTTTTARRQKQHVHKKNKKTVRRMFNKKNRWMWKKGLIIIKSQ